MKKTGAIFLCVCVLLAALSVCVAEAARFTRFPEILFRDEASFALQGIAADYAKMDYATFLETHDRFTLYKEGVVDAASYIVGNTRFENTVGGSTLVFDSRYQKPIAGGIGIGTPLPAVLEQLGKPGFARQQDELIGYKTKTFYIAFTGKDTIERVYLSRRYPQAEQDNILTEFLASENPGEFPFDKWNMSATHLWRSSMIYYSPGGLSVFDSYDYHYTVDIYKDYTGRIPEAANESVIFFFRDTDYPEHKIYAAIDEEKLIQAKLANGLDPVYFSPDKRVAILPFTDGTYERSGFLVRYIDGNRPDQFLQFGHYPSEPIWINERYFCVNSMAGFSIKDLSGGATVFFIEDNSYGELSIVDPAQQSRTLAIRGEDITIHVDGKETPMQLKGKEQLLLQFQFSADGTLKVEY